MSARIPAWALAAALAGCVTPVDVKQQLARTEQSLTSAHQVYAPLCAPTELAQAQANLDFTRIELSRGDVRRASEHLATAEARAADALRISTPCGTKDQDQDTIADVVDECPTEKEDLDGELDTDGCRDVDPYGDEDGDGIINFEDACVDQREDFDGDADADGCPETSEDSDGDSIVNAADACPDDAEDLDGFKDTDGCPDLDNDDDKILDLVDACSLLAEDLDDWDDEDGCPDPDNDGDGVPDINDACRNTVGVRERQGCPLMDMDKDGVADDVDRCPTDPETRNGYLDEDGCPDDALAGVKVTRTRVEIADIIQFESGSARILSESNPVMDRVVTVLNDAPYLRLRVEGHTDGEASDESNLELSRERALAVKNYLIKRGIEASRLESVGYGETRPIDTNRTPSGRARNRRVEFHIIQDQ